MVSLYISGLIIIIIQFRMSIVYCQGAQIKLFLFFHWYTSSAWKFTVNSSKNVCSGASSLIYLGLVHTNKDRLQYHHTWWLRQPTRIHYRRFHLMRNYRARDVISLAVFLPY